VIGQRFELGALVATPAALAACLEAEVSPSELLERHASGDWGDVDGHDRRENEYGLKYGFRVLSSYPLDGTGKVWIITEAERSSTCLLLASEY
jgi:hypothetical protein